MSKTFLLQFHEFHLAPILRRMYHFSLFSSLLYQSSLSRSRRLWRFGSPSRELGTAYLELSVPQYHVKLSILKPQFYSPIWSNSKKNIIISFHSQTRYISIFHISVNYISTFSKFFIRSLVYSPKYSTRKLTIHQTDRQNTFSVMHSILYESSTRKSQRNCVKRVKYIPSPSILYKLQPGNRCNPYYVQNSIQIKEYSGRWENRTSATNPIITGVPREFCAYIDNGVRW